MAFYCYLSRFHQAFHSNIYTTSVRGVFIELMSTKCSFCHPWAREMPWVTPTVAGFICDKAVPHSNPIAKTSCVFLSYLRTKFHKHRSQLIHYLAQSNREPKNFCRAILKKYYLKTLHTSSQPVTTYRFTALT